MIYFLTLNINSLVWTFNNNNNIEWKWKIFYRRLSWLNWKFSCILNSCEAGKKTQKSQTPQPVFVERSFHFVPKSASWGFGFFESLFRLRNYLKSIWCKISIEQGNSNKLSYQNVSDITKEEVIQMKKIVWDCQTNSHWQCG